jgi:hypothetical protein
MTTIALDFDGVVADTEPAKARFAREELGLDLDLSSMKRHRFVERFGTGEGERLYDQIIQGVYGSERMLTQVTPLPRAREGILLLQTWGYRCVIVTSRRGSAEQGDSRAGWAWRFLQHHCFSISRSDFFNVDDGPKHAVCQQVGALGLVDDDYAKLLPVIEAGLTGYLFSARTNLDAERRHRPFLALRVRDWPHLLEILVPGSGSEKIF